jgi:K+:H+ antiporter
MSAEQAPHILLQLTVILVVSSVLAVIARKAGQPAVVGQIAAGVLLGHNVLGEFDPALHQTLFPGGDTTVISAIAQFGLVLFMFSIGYRLDFALLSGSRRTVLTVSIGAFLVPMALGTVIGLLLQPTEGVPRGSFVLFTAVAMSITAVPVLASIIRERGITDTTPGVVAMASAAVIDVVGWLALAIAVSTVAPGNWSNSAAVALTVGYVLVMVLVVRPGLRRWQRGSPGTGGAGVAVVAALAAASAWVTGMLGLHLIFGAFLFGLIMPRRPDGVPDPGILVPLSRCADLLLPTFFVVAGMSVDVGALDASDLLLVGAVCAVAVLGKLGGGAAAARVAGLPGRDALIVGTLLNTRGLTELIALDVGLKSGLIGERLYTILVIMALVTTALTTPLLALTDRSRVPLIGRR